MDAKLIFQTGSTMTIEQFKTKAKTSKINVVKSPKSNKLFMADEAGNTLGGVSTKFLEAGGLTKPVVSIVAKPESPDDKFYLLHDRSTGDNVVAVL